MVLLRHFLGDALRRLRLRQGRTLREVSAAARVSLGYLSEVERGQKEASSELLASICGALGAPLSHVLREVSDNFALAELQNEPVLTGAREPARQDAAAAEHDAVSAPHPVPAPHPVAGPHVVAGQRPAVPAAGRRMAVGPHARIGAHEGPASLAGPAAQRLVSAEGQVLDPAVLHADQPVIEQVTRRARDITDMVPV
jgi:transcriptional regulator with XRE-family HTH domain